MMNSHGYNPTPPLATAHKSMPIRTSIPKTPKRSNNKKSRSKRMRKKMFESSEDEASDYSDADYE